MRKEDLASLEEELHCQIWQQDPNNRNPRISCWTILCDHNGKPFSIEEMLGNHIDEKKNQEQSVTVCGGKKIQIVAFLNNPQRAPSGQASATLGIKVTDKYFSHFPSNSEGHLMLTRAQILEINMIAKYGYNTSELSDLAVLSEIGDPKIISEISEDLKALGNAVYPKPVAAEVRKSCRLIGQGSRGRGENGFSRNLPSALQINIATFFSDPTVHDDRDLREFASDHLCRPKP